MGDPQPSPKALSVSWMQFTGQMVVGGYSSCLRYGRAPRETWEIEVMHIQINRSVGEPAEGSLPSPPACRNSHT
jgi:hypothetical protein